MSLNLFPCYPAFQNGDPLAGVSTFASLIHQNQLRPIEKLIQQKFKKKTASLLLKAKIFLFFKSQYQTSLSLVFQKLCDSRWSADFPFFVHSDTIFQPKSSRLILHSLPCKTRPIGRSLGMAVLPEDSSTAGR